jgi:hypothetical protein
MSQFTDRGPLGPAGNEPGVRDAGDGDLVLDPDANDALVDSAEADRIAAGGYDDDDDWDDENDDDDDKI